MLRYSVFAIILTIKLQFYKLMIMLIKDSIICIQKL